MQTPARSVQDVPPVRELPVTQSPGLVFFSSVSENTRRFVERLDRSAARIPLRPRVEGLIRVARPFVLVVPTYGGGERAGAVPKQVISFLERPREPGTHPGCDHGGEYELRRALLPRRSRHLREMPGPGAVPLRAARHDTRHRTGEHRPDPLLGAGLRQPDIH